MEVEANFSSQWDCIYLADFDNILLLAFLNQEQIESKYCLLKHETRSTLRLNSSRVLNGNLRNDQK